MKKGDPVFLVNIDHNSLPEAVKGALVATFVRERKTKNLPTHALYRITIEGYLYAIEVKAYQCAPIEGKLTPEKIEMLNHVYR